MKTVDLVQIDEDQLAIWAKKAYSWVNVGTRIIRVDPDTDVVHITRNIKHEDWEFQSYFWYEPGVFQGLVYMLGRPTHTFETGDGIYNVEISPSERYNCIVYAVYPW